MEAKESNPMRRRFLQWLLGGSIGGLLGTVVYPIAKFLSPPRVPEAATSQIDAGPTNDPELLEKGFTILRFGSQPVILVRVSDTDFRAFTATCTHLDCIVTYREDKKLIWCYCHNGIYDLTGRNIGGPPPRPLTPFEVNLVEKSGSVAKTIVITKT